MLKSMTGFGKVDIQTEQYAMTIEIKSVNHRFLDIQCRLPATYSFLEMSIRECIKQKIHRGRVECMVSIQANDTYDKKVQVDWNLIDSYFEQLNEGYQNRFGTSVSSEQFLQGIMQQSELFVTLETNIASIVSEEAILEAVSQAVDKVEYTRIKEGSGLKKAMKLQIDALSPQLTCILQEKKEFEREYKDRLDKKLADLLTNESYQERLLTEVAIIVDRADVQEELDRLNIHIDQLEQLINKGGVVGRELDFLIQEMNREVNTIGSKSSLITIKNAVVQLKTILEKIREQVQNIE